MANVPTEKECRRRLEEARTMTKGTMKMSMVCKTPEELANMKVAAKGMKGIKNLSIILSEK
tara:strand:- start:281 stop:463 length:183 start_codon:yes stop_codon:yes gene_type:complete